MYRRVASGVVGPVWVYLYAREDKLYAVLKHGPVRRTAYLGRIEGVEEAGEGGGAPDPCAECWELLRKVAEDYREAVEIARRALREGEDRRDYREALSVVAEGSRALRRALEALGGGE
ncbi:hypothetical protein [Pyrobaculum ferrireducens]|jgi:hypothetical protein|nr:hypothetical protein [Pyrobaculum ferrireducens]